MASLERGRGRPAHKTHVEDETLLRSWRAAQAGGVSRKEFAAQRSMSSDELERVIQRASKREKQNRAGEDAHSPRPRSRSAPSNRRASR
jgi:hypothetical protein